MFVFFGETPLVKPWTPVLFSSLIQPSLKHFHLCFLPVPFFTFITSNHSIRLILKFQQDRKIDNLPESWGKREFVFVCRIHACWRARKQATVTPWKLGLQIFFSFEIFQAFCGFLPCSHPLKFSPLISLRFSSEVFLPMSHLFPSHCLIGPKPQNTSQKGSIYFCFQKSSNMALQRKYLV